MGSSASQFVPLTAGLIDEGQFIQDLDDELRDVQEAISKYRRVHSTKSKSAKAKLTIEIELGVEGDGEEDVFSVKTSMKTTLPKKPASVSIAMGGQDDDGRMALFVRRAGSDDHHPKQLKLATQDGKIIDQDTGEVLDG